MAEAKVVVDKRPNNGKFYVHSRDYWSKQPATVDGMLGGYEFVSECDTKQSQELIDWLFTVNYCQKRL
jgi:hypothetical protein